MKDRPARTNGHEPEDDRQEQPSREFTEFEELAKRLVRVPKREIDEKRRERDRGTP